MEHQRYTMDCIQRESKYANNNLDTSYPNEFFINGIKDYVTPCMIKPNIRTVSAPYNTCNYYALNQYSCNSSNPGGTRSPAGTPLRGDRCVCATTLSEHDDHVGRDHISATGGTKGFIGHNMAHRIEQEQLQGESVDANTMEGNTNENENRTNRFSIPPTGFPSRISSLLGFRKEFFTPIHRPSLYTGFMDCSGIVNSPVELPWKF